MNAWKEKGARAEREVVSYIRALLPEFAVENPRRRLGEGRRLDLGDVIVLPDAAVQVKSLRKEDMVRGIRLAADGASRQAVNDGVPFAVGVVKVPHSRTEPRWIFTTYAWPVPLDPGMVVVTGTPSAALEHLRDGTLGKPLHTRIVLVRRTGMPDVWVATGQAWAAAYRAKHPSRQLRPVFRSASP